MKAIPYSLLTSMQLGVLFCLLAITGPLSADEATIIGVYENCQPASSTIIVSERIEQAGRIAAQAEAAGTGLDFNQALPRMVASLEQNGIKDISIQRRGECGKPEHGKFVEAVVGYCNDEVSRAELLVDGDLFFSRSGAKVDFETFIAEAREKLQAIGISSDPRVSVSSNVDCGQDSSN